VAERPIGCCGVCPPIVGGGYDCTCAGNPRCPKRKPQRIQRKRTKGYRMPEGALAEVERLRGESARGGRRRLARKLRRGSD